MEGEPFICGASLLESREDGTIISRFSSAVFFELMSIRWFIFEAGGPPPSAGFSKSGGGSMTVWWGDAARDSLLWFLSSKKLLHFYGREADECAVDGVVAKLIILRNSAR